MRTTLADALFHAGHLPEAESQMAAAETLQAEDEPRLPRLTSLAGYQYCDLLLARGRAGEVLRRAEVNLSDYNSGRRSNVSLLDHGLENLSSGRAHAALARAAGADADATREKARARLDAAVDGLRDAGAMEFLVRGLLARAAFHRQTGDAHAARDDLRAVLETAERSEMRLFLIDARIEEALQWLTPPPDGPDQRPSLNAHSALEAASALIKSTGLKRREPDLALACARLALAERAPGAARAALERAIALIDAGWWGLLPDLTELIDAGGFDDLRAALARLEATAASYHREGRRRLASQHEAYAPRNLQKKRATKICATRRPQI